MTASTPILLAAGLLLLIAGAELLVRGAVRLASALGISSLVIGLTVVAFGTSSPELAVSIRAAAAGRAELAVGNVVGSNIFNVLFILGISALITPLAVSRQLVRLDVPVMILSGGGAFLLALGGFVSRVEGVLLLAAGVLYVGFLIVLARRGDPEALSSAEPGSGDGGRSGSARARILDVGFVAIGLVMLAYGSRWLVDGASDIARAMGVGERVIGLTLVAAGTSLPEVATSILAAVRGQRDIAVGNVVGSNIFNVLFVLGAAAAVAPGGVAVSASALAFDLPVMLAVSVACLPIFFTGLCIARWEGALFLGYYLAYTALLILAPNRDAAAPLERILLLAVIPLTVLVLVVSLVRALRSRSRPAS